MSLIGANIVITGHVQGVGFRHFCLVKASSLGVVGTVQNTQDGSVVVHAHGKRSQIEALINELRIGPFNATVSDVSVQWITFSTAFQQFDITH